MPPSLCLVRLGPQRVPWPFNNKKHARQRRRKNGKFKTISGILVTCRYRMHFLQPINLDIFYCVKLDASANWTIKRYKKRWIVIPSVSIVSTNRQQSSLSYIKLACNATDCWTFALFATRVITRVLNKWKICDYGISSWAHLMQWLNRLQRPNFAGKLPFLSETIFVTTKVMC